MGGRTEACPWGPCLGPPGCPLPCFYVRLSPSPPHPPNAVCLGHLSFVSQAPTYFQHLDLTPSPEVPLKIMKRKLMLTNDLQESRRLVEQIHRHLEVSPGAGAAPGLCPPSLPQCCWEPGDGAPGPPPPATGELVGKDPGLGASANRRP